MTVMEPLQHFRMQIVAAELVSFVERGTHTYDLCVKMTLSTWHALYDTSKVVQAKCGQYQNLDRSQGSEHELNFTGMMRKDSPQEALSESPPLPPFPLDTPARPERPAIWWYLFSQEEEGRLVSPPRVKRVLLKKKRRASLLLKTLAIHCAALQTRSHAEQATTTSYFKCNRQVHSQSWAASKGFSAHTFMHVHVDTHDTRRHASKMKESEQKQTRAGRHVPGGV